MGAALTTEQRIEVLNKKISGLWGGGFSLAISDNSPTDHLKLMYQNQFITDFYITGMKPSDVMQFVFYLSKACLLCCYAYNKSQKLVEKSVINWQRRKILEIEAANDN